MYPDVTQAANGQAPAANGQQGSQPAATPVQGNAPAPQPAPGATQPAPGVGAGAQPGAGGSSGVANLPQGTGQPQAQQAATVRDVLRTMYGVDFGNSFQDDHQVLAHLAQVYQQAQQNHQLVQYGQQYLQHAPQFNSWLAQQQAAQKQQQAQSQEWWKAPEFDQSWTQKIVRDQNGALQVVPGADPSILPRYMAWVDHQRGFMDNLAKDPIKTLQPGLEQLIDQRAQQLIEQKLGGYQQQNEAKAFVEQNSQWLHQRNQQGQVLIDQRTNMPALSPAGQRFLAYVQEGEQMGLNTQGQQRYAMGLLQRDVMHAQYAQGQQQAQQGQQRQVDPAQAAKDAFLSGVQGQQGARPAPPPGNANGQPAPMGQGAGALFQGLMADMAANGFQPGQTVV